MSAAADRLLDLRFYDPRDPSVRHVPAMALAQTVEAFQRLALLTAMRHEGNSPGRRIRPSTDLQARYQLVCEPPSGGSYIQPVRLLGSDLLERGDTASVLQEIERLLIAVAAESERDVATLIPDQTWRRFTLEQLERVPPPIGTGFELEVRRSGKHLIDTARARSFVERMARAKSDNMVRGAVIGEFKRIDFAKHEMTIRHEETGRDLSCFYEPHVEETSALTPS